MREIKFRAWNGQKMSSNAKTINELYNDESPMDSTDFVWMQYTGLKDKNGKEIYEGDILRGVSNNTFSKGDVCKYEVMWGIDHWHIARSMLSLQDLFNYCADDLEVLGNIYENPELLNEKA